MLRRVVASQATAARSALLSAASATRAGSVARFFTRAEHARSVAEPDAYWGEKAADLDWIKRWDAVAPVPYPTAAAAAAGTAATVTDGAFWFRGGQLNLCHNALDRHVAAGDGQKVAVWFDSPVTKQKRAITYQALLDDVCVLAHVLSERLRVSSADVVAIYMPNIPEAVTAMLACARLGVTHTVVFGGFAAPELAKRIRHSGASVVLTCSGGVERARCVPYAPLVREALALVDASSRGSSSSGASGGAGAVHSVLFLDRGGDFPRGDDIDRAVDWSDAVRSMRRELAERRRTCMLAPAAAVASSRYHFPCLAVPSEHPLNLLYTSGTTGAPKGIMRDTAGIAVMLHASMRSVYGVSRRDTVFVASDIGWIVGLNYSCWGPLLIGATSVLYEGKPVDTPDAAAFWRIVDEYSVNMLFTAPTSMRAIRAADPNAEGRKRHDISSLRTVFLAGERSDPSTVEWTSRVTGVPVVDHFWQTESGSPITSAPLSGTTDALDIRIGSAGVSAPGWQVRCLPTQAGGGANGTSSSVVAAAKGVISTSTAGVAATAASHGELVFELPLPPGAMCGLWQQPGAMQRVYGADHPGYFSSFDAGAVDADGFVHVMARTDDILNVAGHRLSTGQMEEALMLHDAVAEGAVVPRPCALKGQRPLAFVVLKAGRAHSHAINACLKAHVGAIAAAQVVVVAKLPKTRSGKVLRRLLREIAEGVPHHALTVSPTIEDATVVESLASAVRTLDEE